MHFQTNTCPVCSKEYNSTDRLPRIFITCGHTACSSCLTSYSVDQDIICPIDGTRVPHEGKGIELLPPNYALMRVMETKHDPNLCKDHKKKLRFVCLEDGSHICEECTYYSRHKGHSIKLIKDAEAESKKKIEKLEEAFEAYDTYWKGIDKIFDDTRGGLLKTVEHECQNLRWLLLMKELELSYQIDAFFKAEKAKVAENFGYGSTARKAINEKINNFKAGLENGELLKIMKEDVTPLISALKFEELHQKTHDLRKGFEETRQNFDADFITRVQPFIVLLDFPAEELSTKAEVIYFEENDSVPLKRRPEKNQIVAVSELAQNMVRSGQQEKSFLLNKANIEEVRKATSRFVNQESRVEIDKLIFPLWQQFRETLAVKIDFAGKTISDCEFFDSCLYAAWSAASLQKFEMLIQDSNIRDYSIVPLISEVLPRMKRLKSIAMDMSNTGITDKSIGAFPANTLSSVPELENLELNLSKTMVSDQSISELFMHVKNIRKLILSMEWTQITDESLMRLGRNALPAMRYLEDLKLDLANTKISDQSVMQLFHSTKTVKRLKLNLSWTQITSQSLDAFISYTLPYTKALESLELYMGGTRVVLENIIHVFLCMYNRKHLDTVKIREESIEVTSKYPLSITKNLETLEIDLSATRTTDESIRPAFVGIETVKELRLILSFTGITDETIDTFVRQMLSTARSLTVLEINLSNTRVTDEGLACLFVRMENITTFVLNMSSTFITDRSVDMFMRNTLPSMRNLKRLTFNVANTQVSPAKQDLVSQVTARYLFEN